MKPLDPAKLQELFLKVRKGATSSFTMGQLQAILEALGGDLSPVALAVPFGRSHGDRRPFIYAEDEEAANRIQTWMVSHTVPSVPGKPKIGEIYITEYEVVSKPGYFLVEFMGAVGATCIAVSLGGKSTTLVPQTLPDIGSRVQGHGSSNKPGVATYEVVRWLTEETDWVDQVNSQLGMEAHIPGMIRTRERTGSCPVCFQNVKLKPGTPMTLVLHGYQRPGGGQVHGSCYGVGFQPFELSVEGTKQYLDNALKPQLLKTQKFLQALRDGEVDSLPSREGVITPADPKWKKVVGATVDNLEREEKAVSRDVEAYESLVSHWEPRELPTEGQPHIDWYTQGRKASVYTASEMSDKVDLLTSKVTVVRSGISRVENLWSPLTDEADKKELLGRITKGAAELYADLKFTFEDENKGKMFSNSTPGRRVENFRKILLKLSQQKTWEDLVDYIKSEQTKSKYLAQKFWEYSELALNALQYFDSDVEETIWVGDYTVSLVSTARGTWNRDTVQRLEEILNRANGLMSSAGLGGFSGGRMFAYNSATLPGSTGRGANALASINVVSKKISLAVLGKIDDIVSSLIHELGHKVYFKLDSGAREAWERFFDANNKPPNVDKFLEDWETWANQTKTFGPKDFSTYYDHLERTDPYQTMWLEIMARKVGLKEDARGRGPTGFDQIAAKKTELKAFLYPVSAYSTTDASELFAEVLSYWLTKGPTSVPEIVRGVFVEMVPRIKRSSEQQVAQRFASGLVPMAVLEDEVESLEELLGQLVTVTDTYSDKVVLPQVGRIAAVALYSQTESVAKANAGLRRCEWVVSNARAHLVADPTNDEASSMVRDALLMADKFESIVSVAKKMLSGLSQKLLPEDLKQIAQETVDKLREALRDPRRVTVTVSTRFVPVDVKGQLIEGMESCVSLYVYQSPGEPLVDYNQFVLTQNTLGTAGVRLTQVLHDLEPVVGTSAGVKSSSEVVGKILRALRGWSALDV